jgi:hypothetical protein
MDMQILNAISYHQSATVTGVTDVDLISSSETNARRLEAACVVISTTLFQLFLKRG